MVCFIDDLDCNVDGDVPDTYMDSNKRARTTLTINVNHTAVDGVVDAAGSIPPPPPVVPVAPLLSPSSLS
jgi:hypothetical protein